MIPTKEVEIALWQRTYHVATLQQVKAKFFSISGSSEFGTFKS